MVFDCKFSSFFDPPVSFGEIVKMTVPSESSTFFSVRCE